MRLQNLFGDVHIQINIIYVLIVWCVGESNVSAILYCEYITLLQFCIKNIETNSTAIAVTIFVCGWSH